MIRDLNGAGMCPKCNGSDMGLAVNLDRGITFATCNGCGEMLAIRSGSGNPGVGVSEFLERLTMGDDQALAAVSKDHATSARGLVESIELADRRYRRESEALTGNLRSLCTVAENRLDFVLSKLSGMDLGIPGMEGILGALREAREIISPLGRKSHGVEETSNAASG